MKFPKSIPTKEPLDNYLITQLRITLLRANDLHVNPEKVNEIWDLLRAPLESQLADELEDVLIGFMAEG